MTRILSFSLAMLIFTACQTARNSTSDIHLPAQRNIASSTNLIKFLRRLSKSTNIPEHALEKSIISYIKDPTVRMGHRNHVALGLTDDQARRINSLSDDLPYMDKVRKWAMENITVVNSKISKSIAAETYNAIVVNSRGVKNPYLYVKPSTSTRSSVRLRQQETSPVNLITDKQQRLLSDIDELANTSAKKVYQNNLEIFNSRSASSPTVLANGQEIIESAALITKKTGINAMGEGCQTFNKTASREILETKANVDLYRAQLIEDAAHAKAGRTFASVDDISKSSRLTQDEIDLATRKAFQDVLGYTDDESRLALKRLKSKPCKLY